MPLVAAVSEARSIKGLLANGVDVIQRVGTQPTRPTTARVTTSSDQNSIGGPDGERPATADSGPPRDGSASTSGFAADSGIRTSLGPDAPATSAVSYVGAVPLQVLALRRYPMKATGGEGPWGVVALPALLPLLTAALSLLRRRTPTLLEGPRP